MNWRRAINQLCIDESIQHDEIAVGRLSNWRYVVLKDGAVYSFGGSAHPARGLLMARVIACVTGEPEAAVEMEYAS